MDFFTLFNMEMCLFNVQDLLWVFLWERLTLGVPIDGRKALSDHKQQFFKVKALGIIECKSVHPNTTFTRTT